MARSLLADRFVPPAIPLIRAAVVRPLLRTIANLGAPVQRYAERAAIPLLALEQPESFLPLRQVVRFIADAAVGLQRADLGLLAGLQARIEDLGVYGDVVLHSRTFGDALASVTTLATAFNSGERWLLEKLASEVRLHHGFYEPLDAGYEHAEQYTVALLVNLARTVAGPTWRPREVRWQTRYAPAVADSPVFHGTRLLFSQPMCSVTYPIALLERPMPKSMAVATTPDVGRWRGYPPESDLAGSLRQVITTLTPRDGRPRIHQVADALGVSVRTLQRQLAESGLSFEHIIKTMRLGMAADLLDRTDSKILDIALDLGYSDHAHFTRAFRQWTGFSPLQYRRHRQRGGAQPALLTA